VTEPTNDDISAGRPTHEVLVGTPPAPPGSGWSRRIVGPFTLRHLIVAAAILVVAAGLLTLLRIPVASPDDLVARKPGSGFYQIDEPTEGLSVGRIAPELQGELDGRLIGLVDLDGQPLRLADLRGQPVWLSFFATWCPPCQEEVPVLRDAWEQYGPDGLRMVAVSVQETTPADVQAWADTYDLRYPIGFDATSAVFHTYQGFGLPTHVFIDAAGIIRDVRYGPLDREQVAAIVEPLLIGGASESDATGDTSDASGRGVRSIGEDGRTPQRPGSAGP
jgi:peroxiredoxin